MKAALTRLALLILGGWCVFDRDPALDLVMNSENGEVGNPPPEEQ